jgi:hypothetical protein
MAEWCLLHGIKKQLRIWQTGWNGKAQSEECPECEKQLAGLLKETRPEIEEARG